MSHDLFAAFGEQNGTATIAQSTLPRTDPGSFTTEVTSQTQPLPTSDVLDDEDDFGDFEDASRAEKNAVLVKSPHIAPESWFEDLTSRSAPTEASVVLDRPASSGKQNVEVAAGSRTFAPSQPKAKPPKPLPFKPKAVTQDQPKTGAHPFAGHMDFLFSAGDDEYDAGADDLTVDLANDPEAAMAYSKKLIAAQMAAESESKAPAPPPPSPKAQSKPPPRSPNKLRKKSQYAPPNDRSVFFDAENVTDDEAKAEARDDDDWGDFETVTAVKRKDQGKLAVAPRQVVRERVPPVMDLLSLDEIPVPTDAQSNGLPLMSKSETTSTPN
ncbi:hypothetical protein LTR95_017001, partial [Oleoguttula sp. CCFEE 5521]